MELLKGNAKIIQNFANRNEKKILGKNNLTRAQISLYFCPTCVPKFTANCILCQEVTYGVFLDDKTPICKSHTSWHTCVIRFGTKYRGKTLKEVADSPGGWRWMNWIITKSWLRFRTQVNIRDALNYKTQLKNALL